jgi:hypothetical protein
VGGLYFRDCKSQSDNDTDDLIKTRSGLTIWLLVYGAGFAVFTLAQAVRAYLAPTAKDNSSTEMISTDLSSHIGGPCSIVHGVVYTLFCIGLIISGGLLIFGKEGEACKCSTVGHAKVVYKASMALWWILVIFFGLGLLAFGATGIIIFCPKELVPDFSDEASNPCVSETVPPDPSEAYIINMDGLEHSFDGAASEYQALERDNGYRPS